MGLISIDSVISHPVLKWRWGRLIVILLLCGLLAIACTAQRTPNQRIVLGTTAKVGSLDPADAYSVFPGNLLYNLGDRLYSYQPGTTTLKPELATALPTISADGLTYTIPLRQGVLFHDGSRFDAKAMVFSLERFIKNGGQPSSLLAGRVDSIKATGDYEMQIRLKKPFVAFPALLAFSGLCAVSPQAYQIGEGKFQPSTFVGTGPYKLVQSGTDLLRLEAFDKYWGRKPANRGVDIQVFSSGANLFNAFRTGAVDVATQTLDSTQIRALFERQQDQGWQAIAGPSNVITLLTVNLQQAPWKQPAARAALAAMINRQILKDRVFQGQSDPLFSLIPTIFADSKPVFETRYEDGSVAKARQLLTEAGYSPAKPLLINLWYRSNVPSNVLAAMTLKAAIERDWGDTVQVALDSVESATAYQNLEKGVYPLMMLDWYGDFYDPDNYIEPFLACDKGSVQTGCQSGASASWGSFFYSDRANRLIDQQRLETDPAQRQKLFAQLQEILVQQVPFIPLWQSKSYVFAAKGLKGVQLEPTQQFAFWTISRSSPAAQTTTER
jgi:peptide/nickel transport system substrate-binding protein